MFCSVLFCSVLSSPSFIPYTLRIVVISKSEPSYWLTKYIGNIRIKNTLRRDLNNYVLFKTNVHTLTKMIHGAGKADRARHLCLFPGI